MPKGFSLEANFTIEDSSSLYSRASSAIGLPPWYGAISQMYFGMRD